MNALKKSKRNICLYYILVDRYDQSIHDVHGIFFLLAYFESSYCRYDI